MNQNEVKLERLAELNGTTTEGLIASSMFDSMVEGICMNPNCDATYQYEADQSKGWCDECKTRTVKSALLLAGIM